MGEEKKTEAVTETIQPGAEAQSSVSEPRKPSRQRKSASENGASALAGPAEATSSGTRSRKKSLQDRPEKPSRRDAKASKGTAILKDSAERAGISEKIKRKQRAKSAKLPTEAIASNEDLTDLIQLEMENKRLRKLLAEKLRSENSDLRKKLGLA